MKKEEQHHVRNGFTLVELMIAMVLLGLITVAIYGVYESTQQTASTQEEVVDLQQNLRVAMDAISKDIRMAGFMIPSNLTPISSAPQNSLDNNNDNDCGDLNEAIGSGSCFTIRTASARGVVGRISIAAGSQLINGSNVVETFPIISAEMVSLFNNGDLVRIVRPQGILQPINQQFTVTSVSPSTSQLSLGDFTGQNAEYLTGDLVLSNDNPLSAVETVQYYLAQNEIRRRINNNAMERVTASKSVGGILNSGITDLQFRYLLDNNTWSNSPANLSSIRAVRVLLQGQATYKGQTVTRSLEKTITLRNG